MASSCLLRLGKRFGRLGAPPGALAALACFSACGSPSSTATSIGAVPNASAVADPTRSYPKPSPTPYVFKFETVNDPGSRSYTQVMGVEDLGQIVGGYRTSASGASRGFTSLEPYSKFKGIDYPSAISTVPTSLSNNRLIAGYFTDNSSGHHTWGFIRDRGVWTQYKDPKTPKGPNSVNELLGINDSDIAVGFYVDSYGRDQPYELYGGHYQPLKPPGALSAVASGINWRGDIVGSETLSDGTTEGWFLRDGTYYQLSYPHAKQTQALALNFQDQIVGSYVDGSGGVHGYILTDPKSNVNRYWQAIDEPDAVGTTVITSINDHHAISGWFVGSDGDTNGFTATLKE
jgi:hypothetical protein